MKDINKLIFDMLNDIFFDKSIDEVKPKNKISKDNYNSSKFIDDEITTTINKMIDVIKLRDDGKLKAANGDIIKDHQLIVADVIIRAVCKSKASKSNDIFVNIYERNGFDKITQYEISKGRLVFDNLSKEEAFDKLKTLQTIGSIEAYDISNDILTDMFTSVRSTEVVNVILDDLNSKSEQESSCNECNECDEELDDFDKSIILGLNSIKLGELIQSIVTKMEIIAHRHIDECNDTYKMPKPLVSELLECLELLGINNLIKTNKKDYIEYFLRGVLNVYIYNRGCQYISDLSQCIDSLDVIYNNDNNSITITWEVINLPASIKKIDTCDENYNDEKVEI